MTIRAYTLPGRFHLYIPGCAKPQLGSIPCGAGAGLQNKVLEGMACGLPMVVTPLANEGINATPRCPFVRGR